MGKQRNSEKLSNAREELEQVKAAIAAVLIAQGYKIGSRSVQRAELAALYKRKDSLEDLIDALEGVLGRFRRVVPVDK